MKLLGLCSILILAPISSFAALESQISEKLSGQAMPVFQGTTIDEKPFSSSSLEGKPTIISIFTSWCPVCESQVDQLRLLAPKLKDQGIVVFGILVDPIETPDTVPEALKKLAANPPPFPVLMMNDALKTALAYEGFPTTYFVNNHGQFTTTLFGYHPVEVIEQITPQLFEAASLRPKDASKAVIHRPWDKHPWLAFVPTHWQELHPLFIHFPIAFFIIEALVGLLIAFRSTARLQTLSVTFLKLGLLFSVPGIVTGLWDVGSGLGAANPLMAGLQDRIHYFFLTQSTISVHVLFALTVVILGLFRLLFYLRFRDQVWAPQFRLLYIGSSLLGAWVLLAAGQVGGGLSHP